MAADWVAVDPSTRDTADTWTEIGYVSGEGKQKVQSVTSPAPQPGQPRPGHSYRYDPTNRTSYLDLAGLTPAAGYSTRVTYDAAYRTLTSTDAAGAHDDLDLGRQGPADLQHGRGRADVDHGL
jgi:hypothetical protein